jgi:trans-aconitate methyltransferase
MTTPDQRWDPDRYAAEASYVPAAGQALVDLLDPRPGQHILDLGAGDGALTQVVADRGAEVVAVDASPEMVAAARSRGLDARVVDAQALDLGPELAGSFDGVLSNAALHWIPDQAAVLAGVRRALRPGGRFVAEMGGAGNVAGIGVAVTAALARHGVERPKPWVNPTPEAYRLLLEGAGLEVVSLEHFARLTPLAPSGLAGWLELFGRPLLGDLDPERRAAVVHDAVELARPWLSDGGDRWFADYVRLRIVARRPG